MDWIESTGKMLAAAVAAAVAALGSIVAGLAAKGLLQKINAKNQELYEKYMEHFKSIDLDRKAKEKDFHRRHGEHEAQISLMLRETEQRFARLETHGERDAEEIDRIEKKIDSLADTISSYHQTILTKMDEDAKSNHAMLLNVLRRDKNDSTIE